MNITIISLFLSNVYTNSPMLVGNNMAIKKSLFSSSLSTFLFNSKVFYLDDCKFYKNQKSIIDKNEEYLSFFPYQNLQISADQGISNEVINQPKDLNIAECLVIHDCVFANITLLGDNNAKSPIQITGKKPFYMTNCLFKNILGTKTALHLAICAATIDHVCMYNCRSVDNKEFFALDLEEKSFCKFIFSTFVGDGTHKGTSAFEFQHGYNQFNCLNFSNIKEKEFIFRIDDPKCFIFSMNTVANLFSEKDIFLMSISGNSYTYFTNTNLMHNVYGESLFFYNRNDVSNQNTYYNDCYFEDNKYEYGASSSNVFKYGGSSSYKINFNHCYLDTKPENNNNYIDFNDCNQIIEFNQNDHYATGECNGILAIKAFGCAEDKCPDNNNCNKSYFEFSSGQVTYTLIPHTDINTPTRSLTNTFSFSAFFTNSNSFSKSSFFSSSQMFTKTNGFSETEGFSKSNLFSQSGYFSNSKEFRKTSSFSNSDEFSKTCQFTRSTFFSGSDEFSGTNQFTKSRFFSESDEFSKTQQFSKSKSFSDSGKFSMTLYFSKSTFFSDSNDFTFSAKFTISDEFKKTEYFTKSKLFSDSKDFTFSNKFSLSFFFSNSNEFSKTVCFSSTSDFTYSEAFTKSHGFTPSDDWNETNSFTSSKLFSQTNGFSSSFYFSKSSCFQSTNDFSKSNFFTKSGIFSLTDNFSSSFYFTQSTMFSKSGCFTLTNDFTKSFDFTRSSYFTESDNWNKTSVFTPSKIFSKSNNFNSSLYFTESLHFSETNYFTKSSFFSNSALFTKTDEFSNSLYFSQSESFSLIAPSLNFTESKPFSSSSQFSQTDTFSKTSIFSQSKLFSNSFAFDNSDSFSFSNFFSMSKVLIQKSVVLINIKKEESTKMSTGLKAGIGILIGGIVLAALIVGLFLLRRRRVPSVADIDEEDIEINDSISTSVVTRNPLIDFLNEDDPFEDEFQ